MDSCIKKIKNCYIVKFHDNIIVVPGCFFHIIGKWSATGGQRRLVLKPSIIKWRSSEGK